MKKTVLTLSALAISLSMLAQPAGQNPPQAGAPDGNKPAAQRSNFGGIMGSIIDPDWQPRHWGDQGNGTYINPVLNMDYSDPDVIRVGEKYYMVGSDFHFLGIQILESDDMVNWSLITKTYDKFNYPGWDTMEHYGDGSWAPALRYHDGKFYIFFCTPKEGLFMTCAEKPEGPWSELHLVHEGTGPGWEDPCPFWDEDGQAYLGRSQVGAGPIIVHKMSPDGTKLLDEGVEVYRGNVSEGTKIHKWNGYYYMSIPEGGVGGGCQVILRSASIYGPYDRKVVLETGSTNINGPHQGAIVDTPDGQWWFYHFQQVPVLGRVVHLQPMTWQDGWPVIGVDIDRNGVGEPVFSWEMPLKKTSSTPHHPATSDNFNSETLAVQWQFNHNPVNEAWSLTEKKGSFLTHALKADGFRTARNTIAQKLIGYSGTGTVTVDLSKMVDGQRCGFVAMGSANVTLGVMQEGGKKSLYVESQRVGWGRNASPTIEQLADPVAISAKKIYLRMSYDTYAQEFQCYYSLDGKAFKEFGKPFMTGFGSWKGARFGLYNFNTVADAGIASFDDFIYDYDEKR